jgi:membrane associated rhomboid family serine protease
MAEALNFIVRETTERRALADWELALASAGLPFRAQRRGSGWALFVADKDAVAAATVLDAFERENAPRPAVRSPLEYGPTSAALLVAAFLVGFHFLTTSWGAEWVQRGRASAFWILEGQVWRTVTALTLHVGAAHVFGNAVACAFLGTFVCRAFGPGLGVGLMLMAGATGNAVNALVRSAPHHAVGASTAIFGGVGILVALQFVHRAKAADRRARAWLPIAAGAALLGMLGTGERSDILAHLFGFLMGMVFGTVGAGVLRRPPAAGAQAFCAVASAALVLVSWTFAWR